MAANTRKTTFSQSKSGNDLRNQKAKEGAWQPLNSFRFNGEYHGHPVDDLKTVCSYFRSVPQKIYLAGDSSLDSKFWYSDSGYACNGYEYILIPPRQPHDVAFFLNTLIVNRLGADQAVVINTAIEESTLGERRDALLPHDEVIRDHLTQKDTIIISLGGNDIALKPSGATVWNILLLLAFNSIDSIEKGTACGSSHFINMFKNDIQNYIIKLIDKCKPKRIIVSMIYFPDTNRSGGWADRVLSCLRYYSNPAKLQAAIRMLFKMAVSRIQVPVDIELVPFPMFEVMDGTDSSLYRCGVEPSAKGNKLLAEKYYDAVFNPIGDCGDIF
eukprot:GHVN01082245.1.p1 GENE.GHVN01082245.1~~GHVN01082245.1.p1  ORF type:complete len:328 (+),score=52.64 GHVN01082245.1:17-1000(+)